MTYTDYVSRIGEIIEIGNENTGMRKYLKAVHKTGSASLTASKEDAKWYDCLSEDIYAGMEFLLPWVRQKGYYITTVSYGKNFKVVREIKG